MMSAFAHAQSQENEVGIGLGVTNFMGDLGRKGTKSHTYFGDISGSMFRPAGQVFYTHSFNRRFAMKVALTVGEFAGDDSKANTQNLHDDGWYRSYRNLNFKSRVIELAVTGQFNILKYEVGSTQYNRRWTPYIFGGVSVFNFDPKAYYEGKWIRLQPLGTEGQGLPNYPDRKKYSLVQVAIPLGIGIKYNINKALSIGVEFGHRVCFTDYLDDVSKTYVGKDDLYAYYGKDRAALVYALSRRSGEKDPEGHYASVTAKGEYRGNPKSNDSFIFSMVTMSYNLSKLTRRERDAFGRHGFQKYRRVFH